MPQIKVYAHRENLSKRRARIRDALHGCVVSVLGVPPDKRFQRFIALEPDDFVHPPERSDRYTIIEIDMFPRSTGSKKALMRAMYAALAGIGIAAVDVEIVIQEVPKENWALRGQPGDEFVFPFQVDG
jgi:hypothetical protein